MTMIEDHSNNQDEFELIQICKTEHAPTCNGWCIREEHFIMPNYYRPAMIAEATRLGIPLEP